MRKFLLFIFFFIPFIAFSQEIKNIQVQTTRMSQESFKKFFRLKEGDIFTQEKFEKAKQDLEKLKIFKTLEFLYKEKKDGIDIYIKADDRVYFLPLFIAFNSNKRSGGISLYSGNLFKQGEEASFSIASSKDGFNLKNNFSLNKNTFKAGYSHLNFDQRFYKNGWVSMPGVFFSAEDKGNHNEVLIMQGRTKEDNFFLSYQYKISSIWSFSITPQYSYYSYQNSLLDSGNHSNITFALEYSDDVSSDINMQTLAEVNRHKKEQMLNALAHARFGKEAEISYTSGGKWLDGDYNIQKFSLGGSFLLELKTHHRFALFSKAQHAFKAPFSDKIQSSNLLFGLGIYDREQIGRTGLSAGTSFTYFLFKNQIGILSLMPFYEQAYITSDGRSFSAHGGIGAVLEYSLWSIYLPISLNFTKNINDGSHHIGFKIGGHF